MGFMRAAARVAKYAVKRRRAPPANSRRVRPRTAPRLNLKRSRTPTRTITKRRRRTNESGGGELYSRLLTKGGRYKKRSLANLYKTVRNNVHSVVYCYRHLTPFTSVGGARFLRNFYTGSPSSPDVMEYPCHFFDITSCNNIVNNSYALGEPGFITGGTNPATSGFSGISFGKLNALSIQSGVSVPTWSVEKTSGSTSNTVGFTPHNHSTLKWADIKLICHGAKNFPTKYDISLITFRRKSVVPQYPGFILDPQDAASSDIDEFYNYLIRPYIYSTIATEGASAKFNKYFKTIKRVNFILQPRDSSDAGSVTPFKEIKWFQKMDRNCNFDWTGNSDSAITVGAPRPIGDEAPIFDSNTFNTNVYPTRRVFLMIRATANASSAVTPSTDETPSYDFSIRTKHEFQN